MTSEQLAAVRVGDLVGLRDVLGRVTQATRSWFMVSWDGGNVEIVKRRPSILTGRLRRVVEAIDD